jgi:hypothetical protein
MPTRRALLLAAACSFIVPCIIVAAPAAAGDAAATAFVTRIYDAYKGKNAKGIDYGAAAEIRRLFEPSLAAAIIKDEKAAARRKDVPMLDGSPFVDAQEWEIFAFDIVVTDIPSDRAEATVSFKNFDEPQKVVLSLVKVKNDWLIADITWRRNGKAETLRSLYKH